MGYPCVTTMLINFYQIYITVLLATSLANSNKRNEMFYIYIVVYICLRGKLLIEDHSNSRKKELKNGYLGAATLIEFRGNVHEILLLWLVTLIFDILESRI